VVIDLLNIEASFEHHYRAYGFWAPAIAAYQASGIKLRDHCLYRLPGIPRCGRVIR
jgi:PhoPQ-activated pathogenicity-related protein